MSKSNLSNPLNRVYHFGTMSAGAAENVVEAAEQKMQSMAQADMRSEVHQVARLYQQVVVGSSNRAPILASQEALEVLAAFLTENDAEEFILNAVNPASFKSEASAEWQRKYAMRYEQSGVDDIVTIQPIEEDDDVVTIQPIEEDDDVVTIQPIEEDDDVVTIQPIEEGDVRIQPAE